MSWLKQIQVTQALISALPTVAHTGNYSDLANKPATYTPPIASASTLGGVKQGSGVTIAGDGTISVSTYSLPTATTSVLGGVKVDGTTVTINGSGVISSAAGYSLPTATASALGGVKVGSGLSIDGSGVLSASGGGAVSSVAGKTGVVTLTQSDIGNSGLPYDINGSTFGAPVANQVDIRFYSGRAFTIPANLAGSVVKAVTAATASAVFGVQKNNVTVATFTFSSSGTVATFSSQAAISFSVGDRFSIIAPATPDATLADIDYFILASLT